MAVNMTANISSNTTSAKPSNHSMPNTSQDNKPSHDVNKEQLPISSLYELIEAQIDFMQQWLLQQAEPLANEAWQWLSAQPMSRYLSCEDLQRLINDWLLSQPMTEVMRTDIRTILQTVIYHPVNDNVPLADLVDETQVHTLANYIGSHQQQRNGLIHALIGNDTFADLLTRTLYHAINDFMESTLDKAGGVGKLMKMGRSSFEKATNRNLDEKLQTYLHRNIKDLTNKAEANAQAHLSNDEVSRLLVMGWARIKDQPVSQLKTYLNNDPDNGSIHHIEASVQQSYNRLRLSPYLRSLVAASVETWYDNHQADTIAALAASVNIDELAVSKLTPTLLPIINDAINSEWLSVHMRDMLQAFYRQPNIQQALAKKDE